MNLLTQALGLVLIGSGIAAVVPARAEELRMNLATADAAREWRFRDNGGKIVDGELVLDGRRRFAAAFFAPSEFADGTVTAKFRVEPQAHGVLACGLIVR